MLRTIKYRIDRQSIIQLTLFKITFGLLTFLIIIILIYGKNYWEKEALSMNYRLISNLSLLQSEIQYKVSYIQEIKEDKSRTHEQKTIQVTGFLQPILDNRDNDTTLTLGYYDLDLDLIVTNNENDIDIPFDEIRSSMGKDYTFHDFVWNSNEIIAVTLPIYDKNRLLGYTWAYVRNLNSLFESYRSISVIFLSTISLVILIIILIRKNIEQIASYLEDFCKMITNSENDQNRILTKLPELRPILSKIAFYTDSLKKANQDLESSRLRTTKIMEGISDGFYALDRHWQFTFVNYQLNCVNKKENTDLLGKSIFEVFPESINPLTYQKMLEAMLTNESVHWEAKGLANSDQDHEFHAYPYREGLTVFFRDITESKRQQQELGRLERLNLIGQLAAGISHEIRNPLTTVKGFLQFFGAKPIYENDREFMDLMISEIDRANTIITDFLSLAKANSDNIKAQNINEVINKVLPMLQADAFNNNKEVIAELNTLPDIMINENEIKQLILNLVRNGLDATSEQGCVLISTFLKEDRVVLAIKDQGKGIPQEIQEKMGTPFFTTKDNGTGLGLAISMGIAQRHGAIFEFKSGSQGTVFQTIFSI
ncbi:ATP-binding protein [Desulfosporosinus sp.]|uniref:two-component system sensor histidine kinase NtrB n=1 Tax=Desulfosporosinus sp. TaxID=157907 RepID=UPI0025C540E8|nr:ATP-binding protein [Desulfosporosinus sp.]MBC2726521.1 PAS domain-containing protein [Desulfosporosinus sp.]